MEPSMSAFWSFTLDVYGREGVQPSVIHLQDDCGADVNLLLHAMWAGALGLPSTTSEKAADMASKVEAWRETVIEPLRAVRTAMRGGVAHVPQDESEGLRKQILKLEIESERIEQIILEAETPEAEGKEPGKADLAIVAASLAGVMAIYRESLSDDNRVALRAILAAACPESDAGAVDAAMTVMS
tara:strand:- start:50958 stop:51512 length:555 start_codon:yes stop_codon:yes gene_type:complete